MFQRKTGVASCHFGQVLGDEVEDVDCRFVLRICFCEFMESGVEGLMNIEGNAFDVGVGEGGVQCVGVEKVLILEGCFTLEVRFQCVDGWD